MLEDKDIKSSGLARLAALAIELAEENVDTKIILTGCYGYRPHLETDRFLTTTSVISTWGDAILPKSIRVRPIEPNGWRLSRCAENSGYSKIVNQCTKKELEDFQMELLIQDLQTMQDKMKAWKEKNGT